MTTSSRDHSKAGWEWNGIIGTGQSLSVGELPLLSTTPSFGNLVLSLGGAEVPPWNPNHPSLRMAPLAEPIRPTATEYPGPYPRNLFGESLHPAMATEITALVRRAEPGKDYVTVHSIVGESGQGMEALRKRSDSTGITGRAYAAALFETAAIARLAREAKKSFGVQAVVLTHGETDTGRAEYESEIIELFEDSTRDLAELTGQATPPVMFLSQAFAFPSGVGERPRSTLIQWRLGVERPDAFVCTGPKYQYAGSGDGVHLHVSGYQALGEKTGQVFYERCVRGHTWRPLEPVGVSRSGRELTVRFHVPVPPLRWDEALPEAVLWPKGRGFEVRAGEERIGIASVAIAGDDTVVIACDRDLPSEGLTVGYAMSSNGVQMRNASRAYRWGKLRDSDPFVGTTTKAPQSNYCVCFEIPAIL